MSNKLSAISDKLPVMEHFYTIQGEGFHSGRAAYFIRLAGCDVGCHWCDVKESWEANSHQLMDISHIVTGGEPTMHNLQKLTSELKKAGLQTHLETSGAYPITGKFNWICVSPKKRKPPLKESLEMADELKVVIYNRDDFGWAVKNAENMIKSSKLFLQPEWSKADTVMPWITEYIKDNPKWGISLQIHKFMNIP
jgi:organic radical activating enzyme